MVVATSDNRYGVAQLIVAPTLAEGANYTTIASALTAASSGQTIFIRPGTYTENLTLKAGVNLTAFVGDAWTPNVTIVGNCTLSAAGTVSISGIRLQTNSAALLTVSGSAASIVNLTDCYLNCTNATGISHSSSDAGSQINIYNCKGDIGTTGISLFTSTSAGPIGFINTSISNSGGATTASTASAAAINAIRSNFAFPFTTSSTGLINFEDTIVQLAGNTTCITTAGTGATNAIVGGKFVSGTAVAISVGSGTTISVSDAVINSSNAAAIDGAGAITHTGIAYINTGSTITTTTVVNRAFGRTGTFTPVLNFGGATTGITYSNQAGQYTQIGNVVYFSIFIALSNNGSATGNATITGFPLTVGSTTASNCINYYGGITLTANYTALALEMNASTTTANLIQSASNGSGQAFTTHANWADTALFKMFGFYFTT